MNHVGRYQIVAKLGQGGMGIVYRAFDTLLQRTVAVKVISGTAESGTEQRERFFREARAAGQLSHRNIITIHDLGEHEGQPYLAMEYLEGEDLQRRLAGPTRMSLPHKVDLAIEVCDGLSYAHAHGVVHRDIKPANIFLTDGGPAKILDFGLARLVTSELTNSNMMMGTINYMAPEQVRGERADHRSDVFSLGVVLYELLGGRKAFDGDSFAATLFKILQEQPAPLASLDPELPSDLVAVVERSLAKPRDERYQSIGDMLRDLTICRQQVASYSPPVAVRPLSGGHGRLSDPPMTAPGSGSSSAEPTVAHPATPDPAIAMTGRLAVAEGLPSSSSAAANVRGDGRRAGARIWIPAAAAVIVIAALATWALRPQRSPEAAPTASTPAVVDHAGATAAFTRATRALDAGDFVEARRQADAALAIDPEYAEARRIRERAAATAESVERWLREARAQYDAGRFDEASRAAGNVLSIAPAHADARKLMQEAATRSRGRSADEARTRMTEAKTAARAAGAATLAPTAYGAASAAERAAARLYDAGRLADAAPRFYEATGLFRSAELHARTEAATRAQAATTAAQPSTPEPTLPQPPVTQAAPAAPVAPPPPPVVPAPETQTAAPPGKIEPLPLPTPPVIEAAAKPTTPHAPVEPPAESVIADILGKYETALEGRDLGALKRVWPGLRGAQESALRSEFQHASRISVEVASPRIAVAGAAATATFVRRYELVTTDGQRLTTESLTTMSLRRAAAGWVIEQVRFEPVR